MNPIEVNMAAARRAHQDALALRRCMYDRWAEAAEFAEAAAEACGPYEEPLRAECWLVAARMNRRAGRHAAAVVAARRGLEGQPAEEVATMLRDIAERVR